MFLLLLWTIWTTNIYEGKVVDETLLDKRRSFSTHAQCVKEMEEQIDLMERQGLVKRVGKYETQWLIPLPYGAQDTLTQRWECKELPQK